MLKISDKPLILKNVGQLDDCISNHLDCTLVVIVALSSLVWLIQCTMPPVLGVSLEIILAVKICVLSGFLLKNKNKVEEKLNFFCKEKFNKSRVSEAVVNFSNWVYSDSFLKSMALSLLLMKPALKIRKILVKTMFPYLEQESNDA